MKYVCYLKSILPVLLAFLFGLTHLSCIKEATRVLPIREMVTEKDVTHLGHLRVSQENDLGANSAEGSSKLTDGNPGSKFLVFALQPGFFAELRFDSPKQIAAYTLSSANDAEGRDPRDWTITASNDGVHWTILDRQTGEFFRERQLTRRYPFKNPMPYKYYRWNISATYYDKIFQLAEWRVFEVPEKDQVAGFITQVDSMTKDGLSLHFINKSPEAQPAYQQKMMETFFINYPRLLKDFNPNAIKKLHFILDSTYPGVAYAIGNQVVFGYHYMKKFPKDVDVVTHEIMHIIQAYSGGAPGWLTEGIADYVRYVYGLDNAGGGWTLPAFKVSQNYTDAYRVTARFLAWIELHIKPGFVKTTDSAIRNKTYRLEHWKTETGKTLDALWLEYAQHPTL